MFSRYIKQLPHWFARLFYTQLVLSIYSLLILLFWGIPFAPLSFIGNIIFNPVLILFLSLSTILFFTELCYIPNTYIIYLIEWVSSWWIYSLQLGSTMRWNLSFATPSYLFVATVASATFLVIIVRASLLQKNLYLLSILCGSFWLLSQAPRTVGITDLPCKQGQIHLLVTERDIVVVDPGYLGRYASAVSYAEYTLLPTLAKQFGTRTIDHLIILQPGQTIFDALIRLLELTHIKHLYIPMWSGEDTKKLRYTFMQIKRLAAEQNCMLHRMAASEIAVMFSPQHQIDIRPLDRKLTTSSINYNSYEVLGYIDNSTFTLYPAKYTQS